MAGNGIGSMIVHKNNIQCAPVNRERTCPLLLRVFCAVGRHHSSRDFRKGILPKDELHIYTWRDATLFELTALLREINPEARRDGTYFDFALVVPNRRRGYYLRDIGVTCNGRNGVDDFKTLQEFHFCIGDFMDIAITMPKQ